MRKDMSKVIVERGRLGCPELGAKAARQYDKKTKPRRSYQPDDEIELISDGSMTGPGRRRFGDNAKRLNENLNPLYRFIRSRVGAKWDETYAEICEHIKSDSTVQKHVLDHIKDIVYLNIHVVNGEPYHLSLYSATGYEKLAAYTPRSNTCWVHPDTGILMKTPAYVPPPKKKKLDIKVLDATHQAHRIDGEWFLITLEPIPDEKVVVVHSEDSSLGDRPTHIGEVTRDVILDLPVWRYYASTKTRFGSVYPFRYPWLAHYGMRTIPLYAATKKSMSHSELKKAGIR